MEKKFTIHTREQLRLFPPPKWLVEDILFEGSFAVMYGAPATGKSFVALDLGISVALGLIWHSHSTMRGNVVYLAGEGYSGINQRLLAWEQVNSKQVAHMFYIKDCPNFLDQTDIEQLITQLTEHPPKLIIIDTLARHIADADENSSNDVGKVIRQINRLQNRFNCTVLVIHHTDKRATAERGSGALRGAADTMIEIKKGRNGPNLKCVKQKDAEEFSDIALVLEKIRLGSEDTEMGELFSCVVTKSKDISPEQSKISANQMKIIETLKAKLDGMRYSELENEAGVSAGSLGRELRKLQGLGILRKDDASGCYFLRDDITISNQPTIK